MFVLFLDSCKTDLSLVLTFVAFVAAYTASSLSCHSNCVNQLQVWGKYAAHVFLLSLPFSCSVSYSFLISILAVMSFSIFSISLFLLIYFLIFSSVLPLILILSFLFLFDIFQMPVMFSLLVSGCCTSLFVTSQSVRYFFSSWEKSIEKKRKTIFAISG